MVKISGWKSKTLGTLIDEGKIVIQTGPFGTVLSAKEFVKYGIPVVAVREIREGYIQIFDETPCVSMETYNRLSKYNLATNDLVFARKGNVEFYCLQFVSIIKIPNMCKRLMNGQNSKTSNR